MDAAPDSQSQSPGEAESPPPRGSRLPHTLLLYVLPVLITVGALFVFTIDAYAVLPRLEIAPGFALVDQHGDSVSSEDLRGDIVIYGHLPDGCDQRCPEIDELLAIQERLPDLAGNEEPDVRLVVLSSGLTDSRYLDQLLDSGATILSGSPSQIQAVRDAAFDANSLGLILVDQAGFVRAEYQALEWRARDATSDLGRLLEEARSDGLRGAAYGAAHRFSFTCNHP